MSGGDGGLTLEGYVERLEELFITLAAFDGDFLKEYYDGLLNHGLNTRDCPQLIAHLSNVMLNGDDDAKKEAEHLIVAHGFARVSGTVH